MRGNIYVRSRSRSQSPRHTTLSSEEADDEQASYCLADIRDLSRFQSFMEKICTPWYVRRVFRTYNAVRLREGEPAVKSESMLMALTLWRYLRYLYLKHTPGSYLPLVLEISHEFSPPRMYTLFGNGMRQRFDMEAGLQVIKQAVKRTLRPYIVEVHEQQQTALHINLIVVFLADSGKVSYSWMDSNHKLPAAGVMYIKELLRRVEIDPSGDLMAATNCDHFDNDNLPSDNPVSTCRRAATPQCGMCHSLTALMVFHLYVRQYSVQQIKSMWTSLQAEDLRTEAMALVTACLLQLQIESYAALFARHAQVIDDADADPNERHRLENAAREAERAIQFMNEANFTARSLHEQRMARILPRRTVHLPNPLRDPA